MIYKGYFRDIKDELYEVNIITDNDTSVEGDELILSDMPVTIEYESGDEESYKPYKCSTATIEILLKEANFDLNNAFANRVKVIIKKGSDVIWCGYATPNTYNQSYDEYYDLYTLECQDALSTLQYFKYEFIEPYGTYPKGIITWDSPYKNSFISDHNFCNNFLHIISECNKKIDNAYKNIYVTNSIVVENNPNISCLDAMFIDEKNFFDEDGEAWNYLQIIEEICKYCGITCFPHGDNLYFLNQDAIAVGENNYFHYTYSGNKLISNGVIELSDEQNITKDSFSNKGTNITLDSIYNKVTVTDDLYAVDNILPSIEDEDYWVESEVSNYNDPNDGQEYKWDDDTWTNNVLSDNTIVLRNNTEGYHWVYMKHYGYNYLKDPNKKFVFRYYTKPTVTGTTMNLSEIVELPMMSETDVPYRNFSYGFTRNYIGCEIIEYGEVKVNEWDDVVTTPNYNVNILMHFPCDIKSPDNFHAFTSDNLKTFAAWTHELRGIKPMFEVITDNYYMDKSSYLVIDGNVRFSWFDEVLPFISYSKTDRDCDSRFAFIWCKLQVGNKWLVTIDQDPFSKDYATTWSNSEGYFKLPFDINEKKGEKTKAFDNELSFKNTVAENLHLKNIKQGFAVKLPIFGDTDSGTINKIKFTMMIPHGAARIYDGSGNLIGPFVKSALLKDFTMNIAGSELNKIDDNEDNTEFTNDIVSGAVEEYKSIDLKICTNQDKKLNLSQVFYIKGLSKTTSTIDYNNISFVNDDDMISTYKISDLLRYNGDNVAITFGAVKTIFNRAKLDVYSPEQNIIANIAEQYNTPTLNLSCSLFNSMNIKPYTLLTYETQFPNYKFCVDTMSLNLVDDEVNIKLIQKKL